MRLSLIPLLSLSALALVGCNDGGDDDSSSTFSDDIRIDAAGAGDETTFSENAEMCLSANGNIFVVWNDDREGGQDLWFQVSQNGGESWLSRPTQINTGTGAATKPDIACLGNTVFVVWEDTSDGDIDAKNIYFSRSDSAGTRWLDEPIRLDRDDSGKFMSITPRIVSEGDEVHVVWADVVNGAYDIYAASSTTRGSEFGPPTRVDSDQPGSAFSAFPQVAADGDGAVVVTWEDSRSGRNDIYAAASSDSGETFGEDTRLDGGDEAGSNDSFAPRLALSDGHAYVVWYDQRNGENRDIYMNWSGDSGGTWQAEASQVETDGEGTADSRFPDVAMTGQIAHIAFQDDRNGGYDPFYRSFESGVARAIESERATEQQGGGEPTEADGELRLDLGDRPGFGNSINVDIEAVQETVVVAWEDRRNDGYNPAGGEDLPPRGFNEIFYNYSEDSGNIWNQDRDGWHIDSWCRGQKYARDVQVDISGDEIIAIWRDGRRGNDDIWFGSVELGRSNAFVPDDVCTADEDTGPDDAADESTAEE